MRLFLLSTVVCSLLSFLANAVVAQTPIGQFQDHMDVLSMSSNSPIPTGEAMYNEDGPWTYQVKAGGFDYTLSGHALISPISGDFTFRATVYAEDLDGSHQDGNGAASILVTNSYYLSASDLKFYSFVTNSDDHSAYPMILVNWPTVALSSIPVNRQDGRFEITRKGDTLEAYYWDTIDNTKKLSCTDVIPMIDPIYVMLYVSSGLTGKTTIGYFKDVQIIPHETPVNDWELYQ